MTRLNNPFEKTRKADQLVFLLIIISLLLSSCGIAQTPKVYHVGILSGLDAFAPAVTGFKSKMSELGYVEGTKIIYDLQSTNVDIAAYQAITKKFVTDKVDMIFVFPTEASAVAKEAASGTKIPVVFTLSFTDVPGINLISSVQEPGDNITGVRFPSIEIANKRFQILTEMVPGAKRILVPYLKDYPNVPGQLSVIREQAKSLGVTLVEFGATSPVDLQTALDGLVTADSVSIDAILIIAEPLGITPPFYDVLGKFSYAHQVPIGGALMNAGADNASIFGLLPDAETTGRTAATLADKIFRGTPAGTVPVVTSESVFQINYKAAQALGVIVPDGLLKQADKIIK